MLNISKIVAISAMLMASFTFAADSAPRATDRSPVFGPSNQCRSLGSPEFCNRDFNCSWDYNQYRCERRGNSNWGQCQFVYDYYSCISTPGCNWDRGRCFVGGGGGGGGNPWPRCGFLSINDCLAPRCYWNGLSGTCEENGGGYPSHCSSIYDYQRCSYTTGCYWNNMRGQCQSAHH